jgi:GGDEF domain-containing protein
MVRRALHEGRIAALLLIEIDPASPGPAVAGTADDRRRDIAVRLRGHLRPDALLARWGSDSFVLCVAVDDERHARLIAERLRLAVAERPVVHRMGDGVWAQVPASVTVGVAWAGLDEPLDHGLARAGAALARARRQGRNRTAFALSPAEPVAAGDAAR